MRWFGGSRSCNLSTCLSDDDVRVVLLQSSTPEARVPTAVTHVVRPVLVRATGVRQWDTEQDQFIKREKLSSEWAVVLVLIRRGSVCFRCKSRDMDREQ